MLKIFISSHGHLASGIKSSLDILLGNSDNLVVFDAYVDENNLSDALDTFFKSVNSDDQVVLLSDLLGGSVNTQMVLVASEKNCFLVTGVNLAFVLELAIQTEVTKDSLEKLIAQSRSVMQVVDISNTNETEEDFF